MDMKIDPDILFAKLGHLTIENQVLYQRIEELENKLKGETQKEKELSATKVSSTKKDK